MRKILGLVAATLALAACGVPYQTVSLSKQSTVDYSAASTTALKKGFTKLHKAIFAKIDTSADRYIDEYEAGPYISLKDFAKMDKNHDGKISYNYFMDYATANTFLGITFSQDNAAKFMKRVRGDLGWFFPRLDGDRDGLLQTAELAPAKIAATGIGFTYDNLNINFKLKEFTAEDITAADMTKDSAISPAEFEDLYLNKVISTISSGSIN